MGSASDDSDSTADNECSRSDDGDGSSETINAELHTDKVAGGVDVHRATWGACEQPVTFDQDVGVLDRKSKRGCTDVDTMSEMASLPGCLVGCSALDEICAGPFYVSLSSWGCIKGGAGMGPRVLLDVLPAREGIDHVF